MLRSRRKSEAGGSEEGLKGKQSRRASRAAAANAQAPLIPTPVLICLVVTFITIGIASEHYKRSRNVDPFTGRQIVRDADEQRAPASTNAKLGKSLLTPEEDDRLELDDKGRRYHVIFSTDCSPYQHWQSYLTYFTALKVKQTGHVTRIASGCDAENSKLMIQWFEENIQYMSKRFHLHLTPKFSDVKDKDGNAVGDYKFFNKPFGLKYWLEHFEMVGFDSNSATFTHEDDIVILIDPDMALLQPITADFTSAIIGPKRKQHLIGTTIEHGKPFAQTYGLGAHWLQFDLDLIAGPNSPAKAYSREDANLYFPVGPPYMGTVRDMYQIALKWTEFAPLVHAQYPYLLAEMYAFCIAAAHLELRHQVIDSLMISNPMTGGEGWPLIDEIPADDICTFAKDPDLQRHALPSVAHLCQRYAVGNDWFFGKRRIPANIYDCDTPLFEEPPDALATMFDFKHPPNAKEDTHLSPKAAKQEAFMVCHLTRLLNEASSYYKANACPAGSANLAKSRKVADLFRERKQ